MLKPAAKLKSGPSRAAAPNLVRPPFPAWLGAVLLALATILAYQPVWHGGFIWDDDVYVTNNPLLTAPDGLRRIWFSLDSPSQYFPLTYTVFRMEHALWGMASAGYHWVNILFHCANALLVWRLLWRLRMPGAWLAAAIFALHPVQVESVAWVTELKSLLSLFFMLLALLAWLEFIGRASKPSPWWYLLALACQALALAGKTTACTLPAALLLILWLQHKPINWLRLAQLVPFLLCGLGLGLLTVWWERYHQGTQGKPFALGLVERVLVASHAVWFYLGKLFWPVNLTFSYPRWTIHPADPRAYGWLAAGAGLGVAIGFLRRWAGRGLEVAALFYALTLSPLLGFIMLYTFLFTFVADHYQYVACLGPIALTAAGISGALGIWGKGKPWLRPLGCGALLLTLGALTWQQCRMYGNVETLWRATIERNPACWMARINLGNLLLDQSQTGEAIRQFREAIRLNPDYADAHVDLGVALLNQGWTDEALSQFHEAIRLQPDYAEAYNNLGIALLNQGQAAQAIGQYQEAIRLKPDYADAHNNLGIALLHQDQTDQAIRQFQAAIRLQPGRADPHIDLGAALLGQGRNGEAIRQFREALQIKPDIAGLHYNLGTALLNQGQTDEAIRQFQEAIHLQPDYPEAHSQLAKVLGLKSKSSAGTAKP